MIDWVRELCAPSVGPEIHTPMLLEHAFDCKPISQPHNRNHDRLQADAPTLPCLFCAGEGKDTAADDLG